MEGVSCRFARSGDLLSLRQTLTYAPQCVLPFRYHLLDLLPPTTVPANFLFLLPVCCDTPRGGIFTWRENGQCVERNLFADETVPWFETRENLAILATTDSCCDPAVIEWHRCYESAGPAGGGTMEGVSRRGAREFHHLAPVDQKSLYFHRLFQRPVGAGARIDAWRNRRYSRGNSRSRAHDPDVAGESRNAFCDIFAPGAIVGGDDVVDGTR